MARTRKNRDHEKSQSKPRWLRKKEREQRRRERKELKAAEKTGKSVLSKILPKAGLRYPWTETLLGNHKRDITVLTAVKKALNPHHGEREADDNSGSPHQAQSVPLSTAVLDDLFSDIFEEATALEQQEGQTNNSNGNPMDFIKELRARPALQELWLRRSVDLFTHIFLVLRSARKTWRETRDRLGLPSDAENDCKTARAIDSFLAVDTLDWNCWDVARQLPARGVAVIGPVANTEQQGLRRSQRLMNKERKRTKHDKRGKHGKSGNTTSPTTAGKGVVQRSVEEVIERLERLHLDPEPTALREAFARLGIQDAPESAPSKDHERLEDRDDEDDEDWVPRRR
jgi:hypothetical protein